jgi:hypothetical protein
MLQQLEVEYGDLLYHSNVRWLSRGNMLSRLYALRVEVASFLCDKGVDIPEMSDAKWLSNLAFLVDITQHLNRLNVLLQGRDQLVYTLLDHVCGLKIKLRLFQTHLKANNFYHFPTLAELMSVDTSAFIQFIANLYTRVY